MKEVDTSDSEWDEDPRPLRRRPSSGMHQIVRIYQSPAPGSAVHDTPTAAVQRQGDRVMIDSVEYVPAADKTGVGHSPAAWTRSRSPSATPFRSRLSSETSVSTQPSSPTSTNAPDVFSEASGDEQPVVNTVRRVSIARPLRSAGVKEVSGPLPRLTAAMEAVLERHHIEPRLFTRAQLQLIYEALTV